MHKINQTITIMNRGSEKEYMLRKIQRTTFKRGKEAKKKERKIGKKQFKPPIRSRPNSRLMKAEAVKHSV